MLSWHGSPSLIGCALLLFVNTESSTIDLSKVFILLFTPNDKHYMYIYTVNWAPPSNILFTMFLKMAIYRSMTSSETSPKHQHHILPKISQGIYWKATTQTEACLCISSWSKHKCVLPCHLKITINVLLLKGT